METMTSQEDSSREASPSPTNEALPPHTSEIGTLRKLPNHGTTWIGSSSGIYFVNTVRRAFSAAFSAPTSGPQAVPLSEDICGGEEGSLAEPGANDTIKKLPLATEGLEKTLISALGALPDSKTASELVTGFFKTWHPLFPFLHGPKFIQDFDLLYGEGKQARLGLSTSNGEKTLPSGTDMKKVILFQLVINIASLDQPRTALSEESRIKSTIDVIRVAGLLAQDHDILTIQTLLAAELYLVATIALRQASMVAGILLKLIFHSGLHRCPLRYAQLSAEDCEIRRRIFWSAYALDRHLSQSLGDPLTLQDSDIDVCLSGRELHKPVSREQLGNPAKEISLHMPSPNPSSDEYTAIDPRAAHDTPEGRERQLREATLTSYVHYGRLTGRIIEIFHKSIHARFPKRDAILYLNSDIETWWNDLPGFLSGDDSSDTPVQQQQLQPYFSILYHQLLLLLNRPALSLDPSSADFQHGLQVCIKTSRGTIAALKAHKKNGQSMFLPSVLSANWMAGLIIAFACQLGKYPKARACSDLQTCLDLLQCMNPEWFTAKRIHQVLSLLLNNIKARKASINGLLVVPRSEKPEGEEASARTDGPEPMRKRRRTTRSDSSAATTPAKDSTVPAVSPMKAADQNVAASSKPNSINGSHHALPPLRTSESARSASFSEHNPKLSSWAPNQPNTFFNFNTQSPQSLFTGAPDFNYSQGNMFLPDLPVNRDDPIFWGNLDFNTADVFGSATWENLTGSAGAVAPPGWNQQV